MPGACHAHACLHTRSQHERVPAPRTLRRAAGLAQVAGLLLGRALLPHAAGLAGQGPGDGLRGAADQRGLVPRGSPPACLPCARGQRCQVLPQPAQLAPAHPCATVLGLAHISGLMDKVVACVGCQLADCSRVPHTLPAQRCLTAVRKHAMRWRGKQKSTVVCQLAAPPPSRHCSLSQL